MSGTRISLLGIYLCAGAGTIGALSFLRKDGLPDYRFVMTWQLAFVAVIVVAFALSLLLKLRSRLAWEIVFTVTLFLGVWYVLLLLLPFGFALGIASALTLSHLFFRITILHNLFYLCGSMGVAIDFAGWLSPEVLLFGLVGFSVYDMLAGPAGGPIDALASMLVRHGTVPGFLLVSRIKELRQSVSDVVKSNAALLGAGDVILPLSLVARASFRMAWPGAVVLLGLLLSVAFLSRHEPTKPRAALPVLAAGTAIPFLCLHLFSLV